MPDHRVVDTKQSLSVVESIVWVIPRLTAFFTRSDRGRFAPEEVDAVDPEDLIGSRSSGSPVSCSEATRWCVGEVGGLTLGLFLPDRSFLFLTRWFPSTYN